MILKTFQQTNGPIQPLIQAELTRPPGLLNYYSRVYQLEARSLRHASGLFFGWINLYLDVAMAFQPSGEELQKRLDARLDSHMCVVKFRDDDVVLSLRDLRSGQLTVISGLFPRHWASREQFDTLCGPLIDELERMLENATDANDEERLEGF